MKQFGLWIDKRSSTDNTLHGISLQTEKAADSNVGDLKCNEFSLEDTVAHVSVNNPSAILTIEK